MTAEAPEVKKLDVLQRVGLFVLLAWVGILVIPRLVPPAAGVLVISALTTFAAAAIANAVCARVYEHGRTSDFGLGWAAGSGREFGLGIAMGGGAAALIVLVPWGWGMAQFEPAEAAPHHWAALAFIVITLLFGAVGEELLFRGYAFQLLVRHVGAFATILPVSVLFAAAHGGNLNANLLGIFNTFLWGVLLGFAYWRTQALWLPVGLHFGWNVALPLLGVNLSGFTIGVTGYALHWSAGKLWSGGGYGPEGGVPTTAVVVLLFFWVQWIWPEASE